MRPNGMNMEGTTVAAASHGPLTQLLTGSASLHEPDCFSVNRSSFFSHQSHFSPNSRPPCVCSCLSCQLHLGFYIEFLLPIPSIWQTLLQLHTTPHRAAFPAALHQYTFFSWTHALLMQCHAISETKLKVFSTSLLALLSATRTRSSKP